MYFQTGQHGVIGVAAGDDLADLERHLFAPFVLLVACLRVRPRRRRSSRYRSCACVPFQGTDAAFCVTHENTAGTSRACGSR